MRNRIAYNPSRSLTIALFTLVWFAVLMFRSVPPVYAATLLLGRYDKTADSTVSANTTHSIGFTYTNFSTAVGSVYMEFCSNNPIVGEACTAPAGFNASSAVLASQTGESGFSIHPSSTSNKIILTRILAAPTTGPSQYELAGITNPNSANTYFIRLATFAANNGTGIPIEEGGIALAANNPLSVVSEVPPFLRFCVGVILISFDCSTATNFSINYGELSTTRTRSASAQMIAVSNAQSGYSISMFGTTLTSGNNTIPALTTPAASSPGTGQFGVNLRANTNPEIGANPVGPGTATPTANYNIPNQYKFVQGDSVASGSVSQDYRKYTVSYIANIGPNQAPGVYATTITFICMANF